MIGSATPATTPRSTTETTETTETPETTETTETTVTTAPISIRPAQPQDSAAIVGLIRELADFEQLLHLVEVTPEQLAQQLFGPRPAAECVVVQGGPGAQGPQGTVVDEQEIVAFALFFHNFSTFLGRPGLYLEDLYVRPAHRGRGIGRALLTHLAGLARQRGCGRFEWSVLDWNANAIAFYEKLGATVMPDWRICRVTGPGLQALAGEGFRAGSDAEPPV